MYRYEDVGIVKRRIGCRDVQDQRGPRTGFPTWGAFLFGSFSFLPGMAFVLMFGFDLIPVNKQLEHAPRRVLAIFGAVFALAGLIIWNRAFRQFRYNRRKSAMQRDYPGELAIADWMGSRHEYAPPRWTSALGAIGMAIFVSMFLSIFNYLAFFNAEPAPLWIKGVVLLFNLIPAFAWWTALTRLGRALKFGGSRVVFPSFPYRISQPITIRWQPPSGIASARRGAFTLRCVIEYTEWLGADSRRSRTSKLIHEEQWCGIWHFDQPQTFGCDACVDLQYSIPVGVPPTRFNDEHPVFWELEVHLDLPGLDFSEIYLVPIYAD